MQGRPASASPSEGLTRSGGSGAALGGWGGGLAGCQRQSRAGRSLRRRLDYHRGMSDDAYSQITVPASFDALYRDARQRLTLSRAELLARHEVCEDLAQLLTEPSAARLHELGLSADLVLARTRAALAAEGSAVSAPEAHWVCTRLAELLGWHWEDAMPLPADAGGTRRR